MAKVTKKKVTKKVVKKAEKEKVMTKKESEFYDRLNEFSDETTQLLGYVKEHMVKLHLDAKVDYVKNNEQQKKDILKYRLENAEEIIQQALYLSYAFKQAIDKD